MNELDHNFYAVIISICSLIVSIVVCYQTMKATKLTNKAEIAMYLISSKNGTYVKIKNFGNSTAKILSFKTDVDVKTAKNNDEYPFPFVGLKNIVIAPGTSKIALINRKYLEKEHWLEVIYFDYLTKKEYNFKLPLMTYKEYALIGENDFNLIDY